jgi:hypothetical protein
MKKLIVSFLVGILLGILTGLVVFVEILSAKAVVTSTDYEDITVVTLDVIGQTFVYELY